MERFGGSSVVVCPQANGQCVTEKGNAGLGIPAKVIESLVGNDHLRLEGYFLFILVSNTMKQVADIGRSTSCITDGERTRHNIPKTLLK